VFDCEPGRAFAFGGWLQRIIGSGREGQTDRRHLPGFRLAAVKVLMGWRRKVRGPGCDTLSIALAQECVTMRLHQMAWAAPSYN